MYSQIHGALNESGEVERGWPSRWCAICAWYQFTEKPIMYRPPWKAKSRYMSAAPSQGIIAASDGGCRLAISH